MILELEWRIPWDADWDQGKKLRAAEKLVGYINQGTMFESRIRAMAKAEIAEDSLGRNNDPYIKIRLER